MLHTQKRIDLTSPNTTLLRYLWLYYFNLKHLSMRGGGSPNISTPPHPTIKELMVGSTAQGHHLPPGLRDDDNYSPNSENVEFGTFLTIGPIKGGERVDGGASPPPPPSSSSAKYFKLYFSFSSSPSVPCASPFLISSSS